jgi:hypothetical protein
MGGLVVRSFLTEYGREDYIKHIKLLYFLSTPTEGSGLSGVFGLMSQNPQFRDMAPADRANKLGEEIRRWLAARFDIASYCAYETEKTPSGIFGVPPVLIVPMPDALALCNRVADPIPKANHITIAKPDDQKAPQYLAFRVAFRESMSSTTDVEHEQGKDSSSKSEAPEPQPSGSRALSVAKMSPQTRSQVVKVIVAAQKIMADWYPDEGRFFGGTDQDCVAALNRINGVSREERTDTLERMKTTIDLIRRCPATLNGGGAAFQNDWQDRSNKEIEKLHAYVNELAKEFDVKPE